MLLTIATTRRDTKQHSFILLFLRVFPLFSFSPFHTYRLILFSSHLHPLTLSLITEGNSKQFSLLSFLSLLLCYHRWYTLCVCESQRCDNSKSVDSMHTFYVEKNYKSKFFIWENYVEWVVLHIQMLQFFPSNNEPDLRTRMVLSKFYLQNNLLLISQRFVCMQAVSLYPCCCVRFKLFLLKKKWHPVLLCFHSRSRSVSYAFFSNIILNLFLPFLVLV